MNKSLLVALALCLWVCLASGAAAQPALERLERQLDDPAPPGEEPATGYLGVVADDRQDNEAGVRLLEVLSDGPAHKAGLRPGDLITAINDQPVQNMQDMAGLLEGLPEGEKLGFDVLRGKTQAHIDVTLGRRPPPGKRRFEQFGRLPDGPGAAGARRPNLLGVRVEPVTAALQAQFGLPAARGAFVASVVEQSPAALARLPAGAVIVAVDGAEIDSPADLAQRVLAAGPGSQIALTYYLNGELKTTDVQLADNDPAPAGEDLGDGAELPAPGPPGPGGKRRPLPALDEDVAEPDEASAEGAERMDAVEQRLDALESRLDRIERLLEQIVAGQKPPAAAAPKPRKTTP